MRKTSWSVKSPGLGGVVLTVGLPLLVPCLVGAAERNLVANGSFEEGPPISSYRALDAGSTLIPGWNVIAGQIDWVAGDHASSHGQRHVDLDGTPGFGGIEQRVATVPGTRYRLRFDLGANAGAQPQTKRLRIEIGSEAHALTHESRAEWKSVDIVFIADSAETLLRFVSQDSEGGYAGPIIDHVIVIPCGAGARLPSFDGTWSTNWGDVTLHTSGRTLTGSYVHDGGRIEGTLSSDGRIATGTWREQPSYEPPDDGGQFRFELAADYANFTGLWGYGNKELHGSWSGTRTDRDDCPPGTNTDNSPSPSPSSPEKTGRAGPRR